MIVDGLDLTPLGEMVLEENCDCEFCGRSMIARFGGPPGLAECPSCSDEFARLNDAGKLIWGAA